MPGTRRLCLAMFRRLLREGGHTEAALDPLGRARGHIKKWGGPGTPAPLAEALAEARGDAARVRLAETYTGTLAVDARHVGDAKAKAWLYAAM